MNNIIKKFLIDKKYRTPRNWSNNELRKFGHLFEGDVVNVSGWKDSDKEGAYYKDYFKNANSYKISNYKKEARGLQGMANEFFLDLEQELDSSYNQKFDVVFNHTTLEHIYKIKKAFANLCSMSRDIVIIVVPFLQQMHANYGDYWRFTPLTIKKMFEENNFDLLYLSFNSQKGTSVYIFAIASRSKNKWFKKIEGGFDFSCKRIFLDKFENYIGCNAINNSLLYRIYNYFNDFLS